MLGVGFAAATMRVGLCGRAADFWVAVLGWACWGGGLPVVERVLLRCAKARGVLVLHISSIFYNLSLALQLLLSLQTREQGCGLQR